MAVLDDYYSILQVHFLAEPEVIESAYKRLARKYHPDVNKSAGAESRMKKINEAYATLSDATKRRLYDAQRIRRPEPPRYEAPRAAAYERPTPKKDEGFICPEQAKTALTRYFFCIRARDYDGAYDLITDMDKKNITPDDFVKWQSGVSRIYALQEVDVKADKLNLNVHLNGHIFSRAVDFSISTVEQNSVMGRLEHDTIRKKVVQEGDNWRVYVGFDDIQPYIARFEELSGLLTAKSVLSDLEEHYSIKDPRTGLYNKKGFSEAAQREVWRYERYGNIFSVVLLEIDVSRGPIHSRSQELLRYTAEWSGKILSDCFRNLDILGRWGETGFIVLLPETDLKGCFKAAQKIKSIFEGQTIVYNHKAHRVKLNIGIEEFGGSMEDTIRNLNNYIAVAAKARGNSIVYCNGVYE